MSSQSILIVEDESVIRASLRKFLEGHNYMVGVAGSVEEASEQDLANYSLIITDIRLPGADGVDIIKMVPSVPVLVMTSYAGLRSAVDAMKQGAAEYIAKPFDFDELLDTIKELLSIHSTTDSGEARPMQQDKGSGMKTGAELPGHEVNQPIAGMSMDDYFVRFVLENQGTMTETEIARRLGMSRKGLWQKRKKLNIPRQHPRKT